jgi:hypothetical protein
MMTILAFEEHSKGMVSAKMCVIIRVITDIDMIFVLKEYLFSFETKQKIFTSLMSRRPAK